MERSQAAYARVGCPGAISEDGWQKEGYSVRCWFCMAILGSVADPCRKRIEETKKDE